MTPHRGQALVGHTAEQQRFGVQGLVELVALLLGTEEVEDPSGVCIALLASRRLMTPSSDTNSDTISFLIAPFPLDPLEQREPVVVDEAARGCH